MKGIHPNSPDLSKKINVTQLNPDMLVNKYISSLVTKLLEVSHDYTHLIYNKTSSPCLDEVLKKWDQDNWAAPKQRQKLLYIILVELLTYQFSFPVHWIKTQDLLFSVATAQLGANQEAKPSQAKSNQQYSWPLRVSFLNKLA